MRSPRGFTLVEALVTLAVLAILLGVFFVNLRPLYNPLEDAANRLEGFLKQTRAKAMATTSAYQVKIAGNRLVAKRAKRCSDTIWNPDPRLTLELPHGIAIRSNPDQPLCFTSRGHAVTPLTYVLTDGKGDSRTLQVYLGGAVRR